MLAACLGIDRTDQDGLNELANSVAFNVRVDNYIQRPDETKPLLKPGIKLPDFHTVMHARKVDGKANKFPVVSRREYLFDTTFTVAVSSMPDAQISLERIAEALRRPCYTPTLGRRSCPLTRPLLEKEIVAEGMHAAFAQAEPTGGLIYSETDKSNQPLRVRDVPMYGRNRQFTARMIYLHKES